MRDCDSVPAPRESGSVWIGVMNAWKITLPLAISTLLAGLIIGFTSISLVARRTDTSCGSVFDTNKGFGSDSEQLACTQILSARSPWAIALVLVGLGLLAATCALNPELVKRLSKRTKQPTNQDFLPPPGPPPSGYRRGPDGDWVWEDPQGPNPQRGYPPPRGGHGGPPPPNPPRPPQR